MLFRINDLICIKRIEFLLLILADFLSKNQTRFTDKPFT